MHEMGIAMEVLRIIQEHLPKDRAVRVVKITLKIGKLTAVIPETFKFCMQAITQDTPAQGAEIVINEVPLQVECENCGEVSELEEPFFVCPNCQSPKLKILSGRELYIESIEVEEDEEGLSYGDQGS